MVTSNSIISNSREIVKRKQLADLEKKSVELRDLLNKETESQLLTEREKAIKDSGLTEAEYDKKEAIKNAASVGHTNENGNAVVYVKDIDTDVVVSRKSIQHGLDRRLEVSAPVVGYR